MIYKSLIGMAYLIALLISVSANAATFTYGATTSIFDDGAGNLTEWLHLDQTADMSVTEVNALLGTGGLYEGYSYATRAEVGAITSALFGWDYPDLTVFMSIDNLGKTSEAASFFGPSQIDGNALYVQGFTGDTFEGSFYRLDLLDPDTAVAGAEYYGGDVLQGPNSSLPYVGHFLVQPVPIPAAVWLFGSGLLGLIGLARRKQSV